VNLTTRSHLVQYLIRLHGTRQYTCRPKATKLYFQQYSELLVVLTGAPYPLGSGISDGCGQARQWSLHYEMQRVHFPPWLPVSQGSSQCGFNTRPVTNQRSEPIQRLLTQNGARKSRRTIWPLLLKPCLPSVFNTGSSFAAAANLTCSDICAQVA